MSGADPILARPRESLLSKPFGKRETAARKAGRPRLRPIQIGDRVGVSFRATPALYRKIRDIANAGGRSISQEIELRLEQSFRDDLWIERIETAVRDGMKG